MSRYALVRNADGLVVNVIEYEVASSSFTPPAGHSLIADPQGAAEPRGHWDGAVFTPAGPAPDRLTPKQRAAVDRLTEFVDHAPGTTGEQADQFLAIAGAATAAQLTSAVKVLIRNDRAIATLLHMIVTETKEED